MKRFPSVKHYLRAKEQTGGSIGIIGRIRQGVVEYALVWGDEIVYRTYDEIFGTNFYYISIKP
jgi:hypothetical protein